ncbi:ATP-dependent zinc metalloprotease FtsH [Burkholderiales bacterium]|nr:ATP-dependent zinc metalloprotease FtsH [Burkholderiales bacterium]
MADSRGSDFGVGPKKPDLEINKREPGPLWQRPGNLLWIYLLMMLVSLWFWQGAQQLAQEQIPYSEFLQHLDKGEVKEALLTDHIISGTLTETDPKTHKPKEFVTQQPDDDALAQSLAQHGVKFSVLHQSHWLNTFLFNWVLPLGALFLFWGWIGRRMGSRGLLNLGANRVRIHADTGNQVTFDDVAGAEEAKEELKEVIDFLKNPAHIQSLGGHMPKGVLLVGPPGTGKTLLARAVSGEAGVPFFNISGSEFIELFVGVGAARVRELFEQARQKAPCIIFIDELDAIGGARGIGPSLGGHDEREQTLNQLLSEMDGFDPSTGVVVMAATNRPEILDKALLRAGRFDRQIVVDKPDLEARSAILRLHTRRMKLDPSVDLRVVAQRTPGFVGADLANIANEAAIRAVRHDHQTVSMPDFEEAIDRVIAGPEKKHRVLNAEEKRRVAFHESGHTLVAMTVPTGEPVHKVSIIPRGVAALGFTLQLPVEEKFLSTEPQLKDQLAILLGGRVAEKMVFGDVSSGAHNDLERASEIARSMVTQLGMSRALGPLTYGRRQQLAFLGVEGQEERNFSEDTARLIDVEVRALVEEGEERAHEVLASRRPALDALADALQKREVMDREDVERLLREQQPSMPADGGSGQRPAL